MASGLWRLDRNLGAIETAGESYGTTAETGIPDGYMSYATNVRLSDSRVLQPRPGLEAVSTSGGPTASIRYVFTERINGTEAIWTVTGTSPLSAFRSNTSITLSDTTADGQPSFACHNGKVFMAYNSDVNRLHVYDLTATVPAVRRVGLTAPSAPTVANTGAGTYAAVARYYRVQMVIHRDPSDASSPVNAVSELSASSTVFTPSGAGAAARVTKPATVDSATHWRVYGSADNLTFYQISSDLAVSVSTYDDAALPVNYYGFNGVVAPEVGLYVPPPSCKFLATNGERLILAGAWETSATSTQTTPSPRRVWFTRPLGATDEGDDESITQTAASRYYLDINNEDGSEITGLSSTVDGSVYVFTKTSVWRLVETGLPDTPFRPERVASGVGAASHDGIVSVDSTSSSTGIYFMSDAGPYRYSPASGLQWLGEDWVIPGVTFDTIAASTYAAGHDPLAREIHWSTSAANQTRVLRIDFMTTRNGMLTGGWSVNVYAEGSASFNTLRVRSMAVYATRLLLAGTALDGGDLLATPEPSLGDDLGQSYTARAYSPTRTFGGSVRQARIDEPIVWKHKNAAITLTFVRNYGGTDTRSDTAPAPGIIGGEAGRHAVKCEGLSWADAYALAVWMESTTAAFTEPCDMVVVPYTDAEVL